MGNGVVDVIYKNSDYDLVFDCDPIEENNPPKFPSATEKGVDNPDLACRANGYATNGGTTIGSDWPNINRHIVRLDTVNSEDAFECTRIKIKTNVFVDVYTNLTEIHQQKKYTSVLKRVLRHNLRNDLNVISGLANEVLRDESISGTSRDQLNKIIRKCSELNSISQNVGIIDEVMNDKTDLRRVNIVSVVSDVMSDYNTISDGVSINFSVDTTQNMILATHQLRVLVDNLIENAIEHNTGKRKVDVSIFDCAEGETVTLSVADNGIGMPDTEEQIITGQRPINDLFHGSGLGLWVVRWIADQHNANIGFQESEMGGSCVNVTFQPV